MKLITILPVYSLLGDDVTDCALWQDKAGKCDAVDEVCDKTGFYFGTTDSREPKFCGVHFFGEVVNGDGVTNYKLITEEEAEKYI